MMNLDAVKLNLIMSLIDVLKRARQKFDGSGIEISYFHKAFILLLFSQSFC